MSANFIAHRSTNRMMILLGVLVLLGVMLIAVDLAGLLPEASEEFGGSGRASRLEAFLVIQPWLGGFAILTALAFVPSLFRKRVEIEVSEAGIAYPAALKEVLPWDQIERIAVRKMSIHRVLSVFIRDAESFPIKPMARKAARLNKRTGDYGDINIATLRSDGDFDELVAAVSQYAAVDPVF